MGENDWRNEMHTKVLVRSMKRTPRELVAYMPTGMNTSRPTAINLLPLTILCSKLGKISTHGKI